MRNCYVPKCDSKNKFNPKRAMFNVPIKNPTLFRKWQNILPVHHRPLKEFDRICEQHFREEDILRYWEHTINGTVERMERHKPALKPNAVPAFVEVEPDEMLDESNMSTSPKRKYRKRSDRQPTDRKIRQDIDLSLEGSSIEQVTLNSDASALHFSIQGVSDVISDQAVEQNILVQLTHPEFETLFDEVYEVELPSTLWGIHRDLEKTFICFSEFSKDTMNVRKYLYIDRYLQYRMAVGQRVMKRGTLRNGSTESISELLTKLDDVKIRKVIIKEALRCLLIHEAIVFFKCSVNMYFLYILFLFCDQRIPLLQLFKFQLLHISEKNRPQKTAHTYERNAIFLGNH